jgi:hypothetical protein
MMIDDESKEELEVGTPFTKLMEHESSWIVYAVPDDVFFQAAKLPMTRVTCFRRPWSPVNYEQSSGEP